MQAFSIKNFNIKNRGRIKEWVKSKSCISLKPVQTMA
jgi:hypothetical protein